MKNELLQTKYHVWLPDQKDLQSLPGTGKEISITNKDQQDMRRKMLIPCFSIWRNQNARNLFL